MKCKKLFDVFWNVINKYADMTILVGMTKITL